MDSCPEGLISMSDRINRLGFRHAIFLDGDGARCKSCVLCALICPDVAIEVYK
jgi:2-oxoglutarate ferredoxin oxidoreductase subunit delta